MPCYSPLKGYYIRKDGQSSFTFKRKDAPFDANLMEISCGQCIGCKIQRSKDWSIRCVNEMHHHQNNAFLTLTYSPEHMPSDQGLRKEHLQKFFKRYRKFLSNTAQKPKIRYYACGEYGDQKARPHYHALIFGHDFQDKYAWTKINGNTYYRSPQLEKLWKYGTSLIGEANIGTACYIAKYVTKKINGDQAEETYSRVDTTTGEITQIIPEYTVMSTGIGREWLDEFKYDLYKGFITHDGVKFKIPRYYMERIGKTNEVLQDKIKSNISKAMADKETETWERLLAREKHAHLILDQELRKLEK